MIQLKPFLRNPISNIHPSWRCCSDRHRASVDCPRGYPNPAPASRFGRRRQSTVSSGCMSKYVEQMSPEWIQLTLERIGLGSESSVLRPDVSGLGTLQSSFLRHVVFENQYIHDGVPLDLSLSAVYSKIIEKELGGLCFEVNSFFCDFLQALGYSAHTAAATMYGPTLEPKYPDTHMTVLVSIEGEQYLVDVGNGCDLGGPVPLSGSYSTSGEVSPLAGPEPDTAVVEFSIAPVPDQSIDKHSLAVFAKIGEEDKKVRFSFSPEPRDRKSFSEPSHFTQTSPDSIFTQKRLATLRTDAGRVTLAGSKLITTIAGVRQEEEVGDLDQQKKVLASKFGLRY